MSSGPRKIPSICKGDSSGTSVGHLTERHQDTKIYKKLE